MSRCDNYLGHATHVTCRGIGRPSLRDTAEREKTIGFFVCPHRHAREPAGASAVGARICRGVGWRPRRHSSRPRAGRALLSSSGAQAWPALSSRRHAAIRSERRHDLDRLEWRPTDADSLLRSLPAPPARTSFASLSGRRMVERAGCVPVALPPDADLRDLPFALLTEREQVAVDEVGMRGGEAVRQARVVDFHGPLDQLG